jgi:hypothetical protein
VDAEPPFFTGNPSGFRSLGHYLIAQITRLKWCQRPVDSVTRGKAQQKLTELYLSVEAEYVFTITVFILYFR